MLARALLLASAALAGASRARSPPLTLDVCCDCAAAELAPGSFATLTAAFDGLRALRRAAAAAGTPAGPATLRVSGTCAPPRVLTAEDGGDSEASRVTLTSAGAAPAVISGGVPVPAAWLTPVSDPAVAAQIQPAALPHVLELDLAAHGLAAAMNALQCMPYMGGEASILPGNLVPNGMEMFAPGDPHTAGDFSPLTLARWPNRENLPAQWASGAVAGYVITPDAATAARLPAWAQQLAQDPASVYVHYLGGLRWNDHHNQLASVSVPPPSRAAVAPNCSYEEGFDYVGNDIVTPFAAADVGACCAACAAHAGCRAFSFCTNGDCGDHPCYLKNSSAGRAPYPNRQSGPHAPAPASATLTLAACPSHYQQPGYDALDNAGTYYAYNVLAELDEEGEYYINRTSQKLYVWLPAGAASAYWQTSTWGAPVVSALSERAIDVSRRAQLAGGGGDTVVAMLSINATLLDLAGASFLSVANTVLTFSQDVAVRLNASSSVTLDGVLLQNAGNMALNVTGGANVALRNSVVRHAKNGAVYLYAGDRPTLTRSGHTIANSTVSYSNRAMFCYVPSVALADCGNTVTGSELFGGPHQGIFISGNEHTLEHSYLHDLVQAASDSGAVYMGRDWTYRGNVIDANVFHRINTADRGDDVSAVYLDDMVSGFAITNNVFVNVSRALLLGGGRDNVFANNTVQGTDQNAVHFDDRGLGWDAAACTPPAGEMVAFLSRVPYQGALWTARYPRLATILAEQPCVPSGNAVVDNSYCRLPAGVAFIDASNASIAGWGSTAWGNTQVAC